MAERIGHHKARRGPEWTTVEEPDALEDALSREARPGRAVLVDCLTLWVTNLIMTDADISVRYGKVEILLRFSPTVPVKTP